MAKYLPDDELKARYHAAPVKKSVIDELAVACRTTRREMKRKLMELGCVADKSDTTHKKINWKMALKLYDMCWTDHDIAIALDCHPSTIMAWRSRNGLESKNSKNKHTREKLEENDAFVRELYSNGAVDRVIAASVGVSETMIWRWRKDNNLPANGTPAKRINNALAMELYNAGATDRELMEEFGVCKSSVVQWRERRGLISN